MPGLNSLSFLAVVRRLQSLESPRIRKVFSGGKKFAFELSTGSYLVSTPGWLWLTKAKPVGLESKGFVLLLRKHAEGRIISSVTQLGGDRVVTLDSGNLSLVLETFDGNIILTDSGKIIGAAEQRKWRTRSILPGEYYMPPPLAPSLEKFTLDSFQQLFGKKECVKILAADLGLGKTLAEYFLRASGIAKAQLALDRAQADKLLAHIFEAIERISEDKGFRYGSEVFPIRLDTAPDEEYSYFFDAVESAKSLEDTSAASFLQAKTAESATAPLEAALARQRKARAQLLSEADSDKALGNAISASLTAVDEVIEAFREKGWEGVSSNPLIAEAKPEEGKLRLKLQNPETY